MDDRSSSVGILAIGLILGWMGINPAAHAADAYQPDPKLVEAAKKEGKSSSTPRRSSIRSCGR